MTANSQQGQQVQMLAQLSSQLMASRQTLLHSVLDTMGLLNYLGRDHDANGTELAAGEDDWRQDQKQVDDACKVGDSSQSKMTIDAHESEAEVGKQVDAVVAPTHQLVQACAKAVGKMFQGLQRQHKTSLQANEDYAAKFKVVSEALKDFTVTADLAAAFTKDHKNAQKFLLNNMALIEHDINNLAVAKPALDAEATAKRLKLAFIRPSPVEEDNKLVHAELGRLTGKAEDVSKEAGVSLKKLRTGIEGFCAKYQSRKDNTEAVESDEGSEGNQQHVGDNAAAVKEAFEFERLEELDREFLANRQTLDGVKKELQGWKDMALPKDRRSQIDNVMGKIPSIGGQGDNSYEALHKKIEEIKATKE